MAEKVYLTADQYVVKCLEDKEQEIAKLNEKYDDLFKRFVILQGENKKFEELKKMFSLEETSTGNGYQITLYYNGSYQGTIAYCWDKNDIPQEFLELLEIFGLDLPLPEPNVEEQLKENKVNKVESNPPENSKVTAPGKEAKELQAEKESEEQ